MDFVTYSGRFPIEDSLCNKCKYRMSLSFIPFDAEAFGIDMDLIDELELDEDEILVEQHKCLVLGENIEFTVNYCNKFELKGLELLNKLI